MKGDFTRNTFNPEKHFSRVLMQQGRVQLDADWNEQAAILLHYLQSLAVDLIGPHAGPRGASGFGITPGDGKEKSFAIGAGRYYVNGILCENEAKLDANQQPAPLYYSSQRDYPGAPPLPDPPYLIYLDVWERHLTCIQDPAIREVALGGPDTTTRAKIVWQVKAAAGVDAYPEGEKWAKLVNQWQPQNRGMLKAGTTKPCTISPESKYRGTENQLYRVEIHTGGPAGKATFKWSRDNGSVVFPILKLSDEVAVLENLRQDERFNLHEGDWVEIVDDGITLRGEAHPLIPVKSIDRNILVASLEVPAGVDLPGYDETSTLHPLMRRWDHKGLDPTLGYPKLADDGALILVEDNWLLLEDGIQIYFESAAEGKPHSYLTGDYWLIPARTDTGGIEWPGPRNAPESRPPLGVYHSYAPIAFVSSQQEGRMAITDCRLEINQLWTAL